MNEFAEHVKELLDPFGFISVRPMFGGYGVYLNDYIVGLIIDNELYLKSNKQFDQFFEQYCSEQFSYLNHKGKLIKMCYWKLPDQAWEDQKILSSFLNRSFQASKNSKAKQNT